MGMGGGGAGGAIGAHVHDNNAGQGGALSDLTLLNAVTLTDKIETDPVEITGDILTADETTTSTVFVVSGLSVTVPDDDKQALAVASIQSRNTSVSQNSYVITVAGSGIGAFAMAHNTLANFVVNVATCADLVTTGQLLGVAKKTSIGTMSTLGTASNTTSNLIIYGVGH